MRTTLVIAFVLSAIISLDAQEKPVTCPSIDGASCAVTTEYSQEKPAAEFVNAICSPCPGATIATPAPKTAGVPEALADTVKLHQQATTVWELQRQNAQLRAENADLVARVNSVALTEIAAKLDAERKELAVKLRAAVGAPPDATVDWGDHEDQNGHKSGHAPTVTWPAATTPGVPTPEKKGGPGL